MYSGSSLLAEWNFQSVSELYKNFTRMSPSEFEFLINLIGERNLEKGPRVRKAISVQERLALTLGFDKFYDTTLSPVHFTITKSLNKPHNTTDWHNSSKTVASGMKRRAEEQTAVTCHVARPRLLRP